MSFIYIISIYTTVYTFTPVLATLAYFEDRKIFFYFLMKMFMLLLRRFECYVIDPALIVRLIFLFTVS